MGFFDKFRGPIGPAGPKGDKGDKGIKGDMGLNGPAGDFLDDTNKLISALIAVGVLYYDEPSQTVLLNPALVTDNTRFEGDFDPNQYKFNTRSKIPFIS